MPDIPKLPPVANEPLSLVLLRLSAAPSLDELVRAWRDVLAGRNVPFEIILVDDGTTSPTDELTAAIPELRVLRHDQPRGIGAAMRTGLAEVQQPLVACVLCDPAYRPQDLSKFLALIDPVHFLTGYRAGSPVPLLPKLLGFFWRLFTRILFNHQGERLPGWLGWRGHGGAWLSRVFFGVRQRDVACPYRVFRRDMLARSPLQSKGNFALVEQLAKVNFSGGVFAHEVPLNITPERPPPSFARFRAVFREAKRVFSHPNFGPAILPEAKPQAVYPVVAGGPPAS